MTYFINTKPWNPVVTVSAIIEKDGKFLLVEEYNRDKIVINQPGGHLEEHESLTEAVIREVKEETAWHFEPTAIIGTYHWKKEKNQKTYIRTCFTGKATTFDANQTLDDGIIRTLWLSKEEIINQEPKLKTPIIVNALHDYLTGNRFPLELIKYFATQ